MFPVIWAVVDVSLCWIPYVLMLMSMSGNQLEVTWIWRPLDGKDTL